MWVFVGEVDDQPQGDLIVVDRTGLVVDTTRAPILPPTAYEAAREVLPGCDPYALEAEWRAWWEATGAPRLNAPEAAFLGWVRTKTKT